ncbi:thiol reductant ABC exporter subunit CydD [Tessaracoccus sp. OH4464_COT-324]|uniref:thiol reductant ABC exporter subunit CydD n=1 Tax=Tessaracoccus sp. OH4464_COT-324 TaxID=2491059 RepID=UPI000F62C2EF|nr:thiol reductant ABC exporter subunit CydD [Tessaracoccus sp. OH4464_COT-324]RRD47259.1 thiol reductant ABC exporter subunit CydD [Tessaracoccus sp. OH4464_COT-324]
MAGPIHPRLFRRARATKRYLIASVLVGIITALLLVAQAWLLADGVTSAFAQRGLPDGWPRLASLIALVFAARAGLSWLNSWLSHRSAAAVKSQLRRDILTAHARTPVGATSSASLIRLVTRGLDDLDGYFAKYLPQLGLAATVPFIVGAVVLAADTTSALILGITLPLIPLFMALIGWTTERRTKHAFAQADRLANHFADLIGGLPTLQAFARAKAQQRSVDLNERRYRGATMKVLTVAFLSAFALELLASLSVAVIAVTIGFRLLFGEVDFFTALFVLVLAPEAYLPVRMVGTHFHDSADGVAAADAAFDLIDAAPSHHGARPAPDGALALERVAYTYPGSGSPVLAGFSLDVVPGEIVALAGASGGGKSTALALALGFLTPDEGRVTVGGQDLVNTDLRSWRSQVAYVAQNPGLVHGTVADNVRLGAPEAADEEIAWALDLAGADFALEKPVADGGEGLSAGEARRVALARALVRIRHGARLLILDEPTAGLDSDREATVISAVRQSGAGALIVTHRRAVLEAADRVVQWGGSCEG